MTIYRVITNQSTLGIWVTSGVIVHSDPPVFNGMSWPFALASFERQGFTVIPVLEHPDTLEHQGRLYDLHWHGDTLTRITLTEDGEERDVTYHELPLLIQDLL